MSDRYTRKDAEKTFQRLADALGKPTGPVWTGRDGKWSANVGTWFMDYNATYGGCVIAEIMNEHGGESRPFGDLRQGPREFIHACNMAIRALGMVKVDA